MSYQRCLSILLCGALAVLAGCSEDNNPPRIIAAIPGDGSITFPRNTLIRVQFNEELREASVTDGMITLTYNGQPITGTLSYQSSLKTITFQPDAFLFFLREYEAILEKGATDKEGNALEKGVDWDFRVADGTFGGAGLLESTDDGDAITPQIAIGPNNRYMVVWAQTEAETVSMVTTLHRNIVALAFTDSYVDIPRAIDTGADAADVPQVTVDAAGNSIAVWSQSDGTRTNIWANRYLLPPPPTGNNPVANGWGTAVLIETDNAGDAGSPQVAVDSAGNVIAVWSQSDGTRTNIWANRFNGTTWGTAELIESDNAGDATAPQIAIDGNGNAIAVWMQSDGTRTNIWANRFNGSWAGPVLIEADDAGAAVSPQIAADGDGDAIVVWSQSNGTRTNIWANRYSGSWAGPVSLETLDGVANTPDIAMNPDGNAIAAWSQLVGVGDPAEVTITIASPGVVNWTAHRLTNGRKVVLETTDLLPTGLTAGTTYYVQNSTTNSFELSATLGGASIDTSGTQSGTHTATAPRFRIYANHFNPDGNVWSTARLAENTPSGLDSVKPQIAIDADGNGICVWVVEITGTAIIEEEEVLLIHEDVAANRYRAYIDGWDFGVTIENDEPIDNRGNARQPQIAIAPDFTGIAVWSKASRFDAEDDDETDRYSIQANIFD
jgi:hypothetical protein